MCPTVQGSIPTPPVCFTIYILIFHTLTTVGSKDLGKELTINYETYDPVKIKSKENSCVTSSLQQDKYPLSFRHSIFLKNQNGVEQAGNSTLELPMSPATYSTPSVVRSVVVPGNRNSYSCFKDSTVWQDNRPNDLSSVFS